MGMLLLFAAQQGAAQQKPGSGVAGMVGAGAKAVVYVESGKGVSSGASSGSKISAATVSQTYPDPVYQIAFISTPLTVSPNWVNLSTRIRGMHIHRGRSYEFDRMEAGTLGVSLNNRDAALSPANTASPYYPIKSTRPVQFSLDWDQTYPVFRGITEGFPQAFPNVGTDAIVQLNSSDLFYALNQSRFTPGSTTLSAAVALGTAGATETIAVSTTALPMPQVAPFTITLDKNVLGSEETVTVTQVVDGTHYVIQRSADPKPHLVGASVTTLAVSFAAAYSGTRIQQVLEAVGFSTPWFDLDAGKSIMAGSEDLASTNPLEHINLIAEAEFGRFFVSRDGKFTFRDRHASYLNYLTPIVTFRNLPVTTEIPFRLDDVIEHSEDKLYNRIRITIPSGEVVDVSDQASIDDHFERTFDKQWPYASVNDAEAAAHYILAHSVQHSLRLPKVKVHPANNPTSLWPKVLAREIGERARFRYQPVGGGTELDQEVIIEGIEHEIAPGEHTVLFQLTEVDPQEYWILGLAGYGELEQTTWVGF